MDFLVNSPPGRLVDLFIVVEKTIWEVFNVVKGPLCI